MTPGRSGEGRVVDGTYALEECLGTGGMGSVFRARHVHLNKDFALKLIHAKMLTSQDGLRRFEVEAKALGRLNHPSIVRVTDYGVDTGGDGAPYLVMEYLEGETLKELMEREGAVDPEVALPLLEAVAEGLDYAHGQGILHRDLKPHNVILARDSTGRVQAKIVDFGLARFLLGAAERVVTQAVHSGLFRGYGLRAGPESADTEDTMALARAGERPAPDLPELAEIVDESVPTGLTQAGTLVGTAGYMAPEIADREGASPASDVYSFGVLAYELLVGCRPFSGSFMALLRAHVFDTPPLPSQVNPALSPELDAAILAPLAKEPGQRPASAREVVDVLRAAWDTEKERRWRVRELPRRLVVAAGIAAVATILVVLAGRWPVVQDLESRLVDLRFLLAGARPASPQLALALLDDATLDAEPQHRAIPDYAEEMAVVLEKAFAAGVTGVGLDMVLDLPQWRAALERLLLEHHDRVALALHWDEEKRRYTGAQLVEGGVTVVLGQDRATAMLGLVNLEQDHDGAVRRMRPGAREASGGWRPTFGARVAEIVRGAALPAEERERPFWVDYRIDWRAIPHWSWKDLARVIAERPGELRGRFLIVGGDIEGYGDTALPLPHPAGLPAEAPGVVVQALIASTLLEGRPLHGPVVWLSVVVCLLLAPLTMAMLWLRRVMVGLGLLAVLLLLHVGAAFALFVWGGQLVPVATVALVYPLVAVAAGAVRWLLPARPPGSMHEPRRSS